MKQAPIPTNEPQRLAELHSFELLDSKQESLYDDLGEIARCIAGTPISLISLVDENRQWFKTCLGQAILRIANEIDLEVTAEGIKTESQRRWPIEHGYRDGQGNLFAATMAEKELFQHTLSQAKMALVR